MPQLSLYLDDLTMGVLRANARRETKSLSKYAADLIKQENVSAWPPSFWATYGALHDESFVVPIDIDVRLDGPLPDFE